MWGDAEGTIAVIGERDCSIQRRHQKVVEEAPAPGRFTRDTREKMHKAAKAAAETIGYQGVGTVEFLYDEEHRALLLPRDEHPAPGRAPGHRDGLPHRPGGAAAPRSRGRPRAAAASPTSRTGSAIEVRLYAEDPAEDYQPQSGVLTRFEIPAGNGVRVDSGFESGSEVSTHYDAMLAKVIAYAPTREQAARKLAGALSKAKIHGVVTNRDLLVGILRDPRFLAGEVSTAFLEGRGGFEARR